MLLLAACAAPDPLPTEVESEDGTWTLQIAETAYDRGEDEVVITVREDDTFVPALRLFAAPGMSEMTHGLPVVDFVEEGDAYVGRFTFDMTGLWFVSGYVGDADTTEGFTFWIEVLS